MKIHGKKLDGPNVEVLVIPRQDGDIVFKAEAILDYEPFEKACPLPQPPSILRPGGVHSQDTEDPKYKEAIQEWATLKMNWMIVKSLEPTEGLEWETVNMSEPETWDGFRQELEDGGFTVAEVTRLVGLVLDVNGLNQAKIDEATSRFLADLREAQDNESSPSSAQTITPSGGAASD